MARGQRPARRPPRRIARLDRHEQRRWQTLRALAELLANHLPATCSADEAADRLYALLSHEVCWLLVHRRRWSPTRWRRYVSDLATASLLPALDR